VGIRKTIGATQSVEKSSVREVENGPVKRRLRGLWEMAASLSCKLSVES
jgi:hypothetical protein